MELHHQRSTKPGVSPYRAGYDIGEARSYADARVRVEAGGAPDDLTAYVSNVDRVIALIESGVDRQHAEQIIARGGTSGSS